MFFILSDQGLSFFEKYNIIKINFIIWRAVMHSEKDNLTSVMQFDVFALKKKTW